MKTLRISAAALAMAALGATTAPLADIYLISSPGLALSPDEAREVFLGEKQLAGPVKIVPLDNSGAQAEFVDKVLKLDVARYRIVWAKKGFRDGLNPPALKSSDVEVIAVVKSTPGAVGYVTSPPAGVNVIQRY
jgi:ABC-type phosphate transport system substrate-binding protein